MSGTCDCGSEKCMDCHPKKLTEAERVKYDMEIWETMMGEQWHSPQEFLAFRSLNQNAEELMRDYIVTQKRWGFMSTDKEIDDALIRVMKRAEADEDHY